MSWPDDAVREVNRRLRIVPIRGATRLGGRFDPAPDMFVWVPRVDPEGAQPLAPWSGCMVEDDLVERARAQPDAVVAIACAPQAARADLVLRAGLAPNAGFTRARLRAALSSDNSALVMVPPWGPRFEGWHDALANSFSSEERDRRVRQGNTPRPSTPAENDVAYDAARRETERPFDVGGWAARACCLVAGAARSRS